MLAYGFFSIFLHPGIQSRIDFQSIGIQIIMRTVYFYILFTPPIQRIGFPGNRNTSILVPGKAAVKIHRDHFTGRICGRFSLSLFPTDYAKERILVCIFTGTGLFVDLCFSVRDLQKNFKAKTDSIIFTCETTF